VLGALAYTIWRGDGVPDQPGNYLLLADGNCELHIRRSDPALDAVLVGSLCEPMATGSTVDLGVTVHTEACGTLQFPRGPLALGSSAHVCLQCGHRTATHPACFPGLVADGLMTWTRLD